MSQFFVSLHIFLRWITYIALIVLSFGSGIIKPCKSALGGDQFNDDQVQPFNFIKTFPTLLHTCPTECRVKILSLGTP